MWLPGGAGVGETWSFCMPLLVFRRCEGGTFGAVAGAPWATAAVLTRSDIRAGSRRRVVLMKA